MVFRHAGESNLPSAVEVAVLLWWGGDSQWIRVVSGYALNFSPFKLRQHLKTADEIGEGDASIVGAMWVCQLRRMFFDVSEVLYGIGDCRRARMEVQGIALGAVPHSMMKAPRNHQSACTKTR